eukprot:GEMP01040653.1.p1 GENE.GEMP01040653.1~~GEMP01040653.1.p1  ORF type:complete len:399 (+),score=74.66 GEMP01040653.1:113-1198(+)
MATNMKRKEIPRIRYDETSLDGVIDHLITGEPVIIENADVVHCNRWDTVDKIGQQLRDSQIVVKHSKTCKFRYFIPELNKGSYKFDPPSSESKMTWKEITERIQDINAMAAPDRLYVQESLSGHPEMTEEFRTWRWEWLQKLCAKMNWGVPDTNELFIGMRDCVTPLHMDERENLFYQVAGEKEVRLFDYMDYPNMYLFPCGHPCDRQSMVDVNNPSEEQPKFQDCIPWHGVLRAGDLLYIPYGWFHWLRNVRDFTVSISFWSFTVPNPKITPDFKVTDALLMRVRRNLEGLLAQIVGDHRIRDTMITLKALLLAGIPQEHEQWPEIVYLLSAINMPPDDYKEFLLSMIIGRFDVDVSKYV